MVHDFSSGKLDKITFLLLTPSPCDLRSFSLYSIRIFLGQGRKGDADSYGGLLGAVHFARGFRTQSPLLLKMLCPLLRWDKWLLVRKGHQLVSVRAGGQIKGVYVKVGAINHGTLLSLSLTFSQATRSKPMSFLFIRKLSHWLHTTYLSPLFPKQASQVYSPFCLAVQDHKSPHLMQPSHIYLYCLGERKASGLHFWPISLTKLQQWSLLIF